MNYYYYFTIVYNSNAVAWCPAPLFGLLFVILKATLSYYYNLLIIILTTLKGNLH